MAPIKYTLLLLVVGIHFTASAQLPASQRLKATQFTQKLITLMEQKNYGALKQISTDTLYCYECFSATPESNPLVDKQTFYGKHAAKIFTTNLLQRLKRSETKLLINHGYIVQYTTYRPGELAKGHEGIQFCFWLKAEPNGTLKLSGIETIP